MRGEQKMENIRKENQEKMRREESTKREFMILNETIMVNEVKTKIMEKIQQMQEDIKMTKVKIERNNLEIEKFESEVVDLKMRKLIYRFKLKEMYVGLMRFPEELL